MVGTEAKTRRPDTSNVKAVVGVKKGSGRWLCVPRPFTAAALQRMKAQMC